MKFIYYFTKRIVMMDVTILSVPFCSLTIEEFQNNY